MLVYGKNVLYETDKKNIKKVYVYRKEYIDYLKKEKIKYDIVDINKLNSLVDGNHQGIVLDVLDYEYYDFKKIDSDFVVILDHLTDPHNFGAIIRSCACCGIKDIIIPSKRSVLVNDTVIKVSAGNIKHVNISMVSNINNAINTLKNRGYFVYSADMYGTNYKNVDYATKKCLVIGSEGDGVSRLVKENSDVLVSINIMDDTESLNASVAAGILMFEMRN